MWEAWTSSKCGNKKTFHTLFSSFLSVIGQKGDIGEKGRAGEAGFTGTKGELGIKGLMRSLCSNLFIIQQENSTNPNVRLKIRAVVNLVFGIKKLNVC